MTTRVLVWRWAGGMLGFGLLVAAVWLMTADVYVAEPRDPPDGAFCGSAYDVTLLKGDGDMGGEPVDNQGIIDRQCVVASGRYVVAGTATGTLGVVLLALLVSDVVRSPRPA